MGRANQQHQSLEPETRRNYTALYYGGNFQVWREAKFQIIEGERIAEVFGFQVDFKFGTFCGRKPFERLLNVQETFSPSATKRGLLNATSVTSQCLRPVLQFLKCKIVAFVALGWPQELL
jgi:hypothetical protein